MTVILRMSKPLYRDLADVLDMGYDGQRIQTVIPEE